MPITNPDYSILNHEEMAKAIGLKAKHMPMLIGSFLEESAPILIELESAVVSKDYNEIQNRAHSIKGSAGNLRFDELAEMAKEMEHAGAAAEENFDYSSYLEALKKAINTISL